MWFLHTFRPKALVVEGRIPQYCPPDSSPAGIWDCHNQTTCQSLQCLHNPHPLQKHPLSCHQVLRLFRSLPQSGTWLGSVEKCLSAQVGKGLYEIAWSHFPAVYGKEQVVSLGTATSQQQITRHITNTKHSLRNSSRIRTKHWGILGILDQFFQSSHTKPMITKSTMMPPPSKPAIIPASSTEKSRTI